MYKFNGFNIELFTTILITNVCLKRIGILQSDIYSFCDLSHLFLECRYVEELYEILIVD